MGSVEEVGNGWEEVVIDGELKTTFTPNLLGIGLLAFFFILGIILIRSLSSGTRSGDSEGEVNED